MTPFIVEYLWLIPAAPLAATVLILLFGAKNKSLASTLALIGQVVAITFSITALVHTLGDPGTKAAFNVPWFQVGGEVVRVGWVLDPLTAVMAVMVSFVGFWIFLFSVGYMAEDRNYSRFFLYLSFFSMAMLGVVIANSLLLLFICWELVGLASYLLIGFWIHKPSAAAAARKAFITTRVGDMGFFLGMLWLYRDSGTLLFYDGGKGCLEPVALGMMAWHVAISVLIFCGAVGKSGQFPLHVWLPDAMEGPTPVSALIHAATMVAAGVFLVARMFPIFELKVEGVPVVLELVVWVGLFTSLFAALIAVGQFDIKRILAYSTVSQLGLMMMALGLGGPIAGIAHLLTHGFFKALLFLGSGSVIHGCHEEQDIRYMGGLRKVMPVTFATYAVGMMALAGVPVFFCGAWSKEAILESAHGWQYSHLPYYLTLFGVFMTAFYMTRQMAYVFFGESRLHHGHHAHESPRVMTLPLIILATCSVALSAVLTPAWPWMESHLSGHTPKLHFAELFSHEVIAGIITSLVVVAAGIGAGWAVYGRAAGKEPLAEISRPIFAILNGRFYIDELYDATVIAGSRFSATLSDWMDRRIWDGMVRFVGDLGIWLGLVTKAGDDGAVNGGVDILTEETRYAGRRLASAQSGLVQQYLGVLAGTAVIALIVLFVWFS